MYTVSHQKRTRIYLTVTLANLTDFYGHPCVCFAFVRILSVFERSRHAPRRSQNAI